MRTLLLACIPLLLCTEAGAQNRSNEYGVLSLDAGTFFAHHPGHDIATSFPYTVTSLTSGGSTQSTFNGSLQGKFTSPAYLAGLKFDYGWRRSVVDLGAGFFRANGGDHGVYLKAGYGYNLYLGGLAVRPAVDFYYLMGKDKMGTLDNSQKQISLLGFMAYEQYTVSQDDGDGSSYDETYNADHLDINYRRFTLLGNPKIVVSTPSLGRLVVNLEFGWLVQLYQRCDLQLEQTNTSHDETHTVGKVMLDMNGSLGGAFAAINIGVRL